MPDHGFEWRRGEVENGHAWEHGYRNGVLVTIRCATCGHPPINVMREDFSIEPCRRPTYA